MKPHLLTSPLSPHDAPHRTSTSWQFHAIMRHIELTREHFLLSSRMSCMSNLVSREEKRFCWLTHYSAGALLSVMIANYTRIKVPKMNWLVSSLSYIFLWAKEKKNSSESQQFKWSDLAKLKRLKLDLRLLYLITFIQRCVAQKRRRKKERAIPKKT